MTTDAAAPPTLGFPRRRTHGPAAGERVGAASGVIAAVMLVVAAGILSSTPSVDATPADVRLHLVQRAALTSASAYASVIAAVLLVPFLASLRSFTTRRRSSSAWRQHLALVTGAVGIAMQSLAGALLATAVLLAGRTSDTEAVFALFVSAKLAATLAILPVTAVVLANARTIATSQPGAARWLIRFDVQIAVITVLASIVAFVDHDALTPGEPVAAATWLLVASWVVALARTVARGDRTELSKDNHAPL